MKKKKTNKKEKKSEYDEKKKGKNDLYQRTKPTHFLGSTRWGVLQIH